MSKLMRTSRGVIEVTSGSDLFLNISEVAKTNLGVADLYRYRGLSLRQGY